MRSLLDNIIITEKMVRKKLSEIRADKAGGPDQLTPWLLLLFRDEISCPLWLLFIKSLQDGVVPQDWKTANVLPIFKKGSRSPAANHRLVSLRSQCSKLLESLICDAVIKHLESN